MANLGFELGFDWQVNPILGVRDGVYPLQATLVDDDEGAVISSCNPDQVPEGAGLRFRIYDFTHKRHKVVTPAPSPKVLQILFTSGTVEGDDPMSPVGIDGEARTQWAATEFRPCDRDSLAYRVESGWEAVWADGRLALPLSSSGRFKFRGLLTLEAPGEMARFYRIDPEMVVGGSGTDG